MIRRARSWHAGRSRQRWLRDLLMEFELRDEAEALEDVREDHLDRREHAPTVAIGGEAVQQERTGDVRYA